MMFSLPPADSDIPEDYVKAMNVLFIYFMRTMSKIVRLPPSVWWAAAWRTCLLLFLQELRPCGDPCMAARIKLFWKCCKQSMRQRWRAEVHRQSKKPQFRFPFNGFGHRVYKNFDPRANIIKTYCDRILQITGKSDPLLEIARELEETVLRDEFFLERKLYPNVDFYSGIIYKALGFPTPMFTALFAIGRLPGWIAHWVEMNSAPLKIGRPRQIYRGSPERAFVTINQRR